MRIIAEIIPWILIPLLTVGVPLGALGYFGWLGLRYVRAREGMMKIAPEAPAQVTQGAEEKLEEMQREIDRLREHQDFMEKLLAKSRTDRISDTPPNAP